MKPFLYLASTLVAASMLASCGSKQEASVNEDSLRAAQEQMRQDSLQAVQQRLDSLREDSIANAEKKAAMQLKVTTFIEKDKLDHVLSLRSFSKTISSLKALGFTVENTYTKYTEDCGEPGEDKVTEMERDLDGEFTKITIGDGYRVTIVFSNDESLQVFKASIKSAGYKSRDGKYYEGPNTDCYWNGSDITIKGHTVTIEGRTEC